MNPLTNPSTHQPDHVVVIGGAGFGRETLDTLEAMIAAGAPVIVDGVLDDAPTDVTSQRLQERGVPHLGSIESWLSSDSTALFLLAIGDPAIRTRLVHTIELAGRRAFTAVHPSAIIGSRPTFHEGVVICAGAVVSTNVELGRHVHVNPNATIGHDAIMRDFTSLNPGATLSGEVVVHEGTLVGSGAIILQGLEVGSNCTVGAGSVVTKSVPDGVIVKGMPGRW